MQTHSWTTIDKSTWGDGPWQSEPDKVQWQDEATNLPCLIHRNPLGGLCGYVGVSEGHPLFDKEDSYPDLDCHGGITFANFCQPHTEDGSHGICHIPYLGEPDRVYWLGFDCGHSGDLQPGMMAQCSTIYQSLFKGNTYRDIQYVKAQVISLAAQLKAMEK